MKQIVNKKATHNYDIIQKYETGIILKGSEIKSIRAGNVSLNESYCTVSKKREVFLVNAHIAKFDKSSLFNHEENRKRKLLLHKSEINKIVVKTNEIGYALVPLKMYFKQALCKVEIALCKGLKSYDKRQKLKTKDQDMAIKKALKYHGH